MRKMIFFLWILFLSPSITWTQERVEAPVWNVGDKWVFTQGNSEVIGEDKKSYALKFSKNTCIIENVGSETIIFEKSTLNRTYVLKGDMREKYTLGRRRILNFPLNPGKQWQDAYEGKVLTGPYAGRWTNQYSESFAVSGWENVEVRAGKFKAIKLDYKIKITTPVVIIGSREGWMRYWYSPDAKYFVKCEYDKDFYAEVNDWELVFFTIKK